MNKKRLEHLVPDQISQKSFLTNFRIDFCAHYAPGMNRKHVFKKNLMFEAVPSGSKIFMPVDTTYTKKRNFAISICY